MSLTVQPAWFRGVTARAAGAIGRLISSVWETSRARRSRPLLYIAVGAVAGAAVLLMVSSLLGAAVETWSRGDVQLRARIVLLSARDQIEQLARDPSPEAATKLQALFTRLITDERLQAVGICDPDGKMRTATDTMPARLLCASIRRSKAETTVPIRIDSQDLLVSAFPLAEGKEGHVVIVHDLTYAKARSDHAQTFIMVTTIIAALLASGAVAVAMLMLVRNWRAALRATLDDLRAGRLEGAGPVTTLPAELREALDQYDLVRRTIDGIHIDWTPDTLQRALGSELPGAEVLVVSNREPYIHNHTDAGITVQLPASGLVSAIEPVIRACGGTWIAHGSGSADRDSVDAADRIAVPPDAPSYTLRRIWLTDEEQDGYYYGFANEGMWPLCHIAFVRPTFREADWRYYREVNQKFADAVVREAKTHDPIVLVQDYHFALLPRMVRKHLPKATIITFWHIPWPNAETFGICPWKEEIIEGLLGSSILGFHTNFHCNNFFETIDRFVESRIDRERRSITLGGQETMVRAYPISIEWPPSALAGQAPVPACRAAVRQRFGLGEGVRVGIGIERFDYTKGILDRLHGVDVLLSRHPEWRGAVTFIQAAAPTRSKIASYRALQDEAVALAEEINNRYRTPDWQPLILSIRHHQPPEVFELFRAADFCVVSSLHDGMNLVAKEFVAARDDERGVLVLSTFAGASRELAEALIVNPYHAHDMAEAIHRALMMPVDEQEARMRQMRALVRTRNVYRWAGQMLLDAAQLRRREGIERLAAANLPAVPRLLGRRLA
ncbi:alpha,alpha-trehalose-phosphate synthase (UDP-forming) [Blastochloris viridis]|uniref:Trehalose-phosphate synthase n=1 Tax=Blastochloris viridis TaxID=1079 RepID=A0A0H5BBQ1_BLAVI|nr:trehalose-6-phosphate synthase [Blastochloris viridis]ALK10378.1 Trehalose-phosphate synthase [Blastochloris viridis]BAR99682.1 alpha,alpha-trehalose-phosphate synthase [UDP-forming] [Blastochloris viridis]CUU43040.1 Trehalose-phosphate synthase [Blastochloris viridis]